MKPIIECCFSPSLLSLYDLKSKIVIVIDVFRATSTIASVLDKGALKVIPVDDVTRAIQLGTEIPESITAGERNGQIVEGLQHGNSPTEYTTEMIQNKTLILTTTNGTRLLHQCKDADEILTASFLNLSATADYLIRQNKPVLLACASWKDRFNLEDSIFAGAIYKKIKNHFITQCDSTLASEILYEQASKDLIGFIKNCSHYHRLSQYGLQGDLEYCMQMDRHNHVNKFSTQAITLWNE